LFFKEFTYFLGDNYGIPQFFNEKSGQKSGKIVMAGNETVFGWKTAKSAGKQPKRLEMAGNGWKFGWKTAKTAGNGWK